MFLCMCPNVLVYVKHFSRCGYCRRRFFFWEKGRSRIWGHVQIVKYVFFTYFKHFPRCGYCRRRFFFREKGRSRILGTCHIGENTVFQLFCVSGALWVTFGVPLAPFGVALAPFGVPLGSLWGALGSLWVPLSSLWLPLGRLGLPLQTSSSMFTVCDACRQNQASGTRRRSHRSHQSHRSGVKNCDSEPTSHTRRGPG